MKKFYKREVLGFEFEITIMTLCIFIAGYGLGSLLVLAGLV